MTPRVFVLVLALAALPVGCQGYSDPEHACAAFMSAVHEQDAAAVFDSLLQTTQWSFHTVAKQQRNMRGLIASSYPREAQEAALARLLPEAGSGRDLFRLLYPKRHAEDFQRRLGHGAPHVQIEPSGSAASCAREKGRPFRFVRTESGRWGMSELDAEWDAAQLRAVHDFDTVRENARLYTMIKGKP